MIDTTLDRAYLLEQERREVEPERLLIAQVLNRGLLDACDQRKQRPGRRRPQPRLRFGKTMEHPVNLSPTSALRGLLEFSP